MSDSMFRIRSTGIDTTMHRTRVDHLTRPPAEVKSALYASWLEFLDMPFEQQRAIDDERWVPTRETMRLFITALDEGFR